MIERSQMTSSRAPLRTLSLLLVALAALSPATTEAQACTDCDGGMDATVPTDAALAQPDALDGSVEAGVSPDGGSSDAAVTTVVVGLDASSVDAGAATNGGGVTWVHEGCSLAAAPGRATVLSYAGVLAAMALLLRRRRARRAL
jgi:hypothetical protein